jgi:predicted NBD/HSP70 family sugar kinase
MLDTFLSQAQQDNPVYITDVRQAFALLPESESHDIHCRLDFLEPNEHRWFSFRIPSLIPMETSNEKLEFVQEYLFAEIYNILSALGGRRMDIYMERNSKSLTDLLHRIPHVFGEGSTRSERRRYGRALNVIDRMLGAILPERSDFSFNIHTDEAVPNDRTDRIKRHTPEHSLFTRVTHNLEGKLLIGMDIGGTDIKAVMVKGQTIVSYKEYDWFPASFTTSRQLVDPICLLVELLRAHATVLQVKSENLRDRMLEKIESALATSASEQTMRDTIAEVKSTLEQSSAEINGLGMCFPDVVVQNKIVGGEVYKTRGIRSNPEIDYEKDFSQLTELDVRLHRILGPQAKIRIINDGPMAAFTAAVEMAANDGAQLAEGVLAYTLGTELGTGWVLEDGTISDIPLEVYNFIIDLGSKEQRKHHPDDIRSVNNFNTSIAGTVQKYACQSGVFRLAMKYFPSERPDLYLELKDKGFIVERKIDGELRAIVPTEPKDLRKPFLEHMMSLPDREHDTTNDKIWREIGKALAIAWIETKRILQPKTNTPILFGRLVKQPSCLRLLREGARTVDANLHYEVADATLANTPLMKQLDSHHHYTVAQFAQAIGAVYFINQDWPIA